MHFVQREVVVADGPAVEVEAAKAQRAAVERGATDRALDRELLAQQRTRQGGIVGAGHGELAPRRVADDADLHRGRPAGIIKLGRVPIRFGLEGRLPRAVNRAN